MVAETESKKPKWKTEGPTDLLALFSVNPEADAFTTANGAKEIPSEWIVKYCEDVPVYVVHDADKPGQEGATFVPSTDGIDRPGWCPTLAKSASDVRNVTLPFPVEATNGPDLRDFFAGGGTYDDLVDRALAADPFDMPEGPPPIDEAEDDPHRLARVNLHQYQTEHDGRLVFWRDEWWKWKGGKYRKIEIGELKAKVCSAVRAEFERNWRARRLSNDDQPIRKVTRSLVSNVIGAMESLCSISSSIPMPCWIPERSQPHYLAVSNGILDLEAVFNGKSREEFLFSHSPDWFSTFRLDYEFDENADCPKWMKYLDESMEGDADRIRLLQQWAGYLLTSRNDHQRFLVLEGEGRNGKTVYFAAMTAMLGGDNVSHVSIENFDGRFELGTTIGKAANISGDAGEIDSIAEGILKQFTGGDIMQFDRKNLPPISARPTAKLMAAWNSRPRIKDKSMGLWRRMLLVPFRRRVENPIRGMDDARWWTEQGETPGILNWAIAGLDDLRRSREFIDPAVCVDAINEYRDDSNPAATFLDDFLESDPNGEVETQLLYEVYCKWCRATGHKGLGERQFGKEFKKKFPSSPRKKRRQGENLFWIRENIRFQAEEIDGISTKSPSGKYF